MTWEEIYEFARKVLLWEIFMLGLIIGLAIGFWAGLRV